MRVSGAAIRIAIVTSMVVPLVAFQVHAQPAGKGGEAGPSGWGPGTMMGLGMMGCRGMGFMCNPRLAGMAEWRIKKIEAAVKPTEAQRSALNELRAASTKAAEMITATCSTEVPAKSTERLALMEKRMEAMLQAIKLVKPAFDTFYATLDPEQKTRLDASGPRQWGWRHWRWPWSDR
jgi:LTXXQ motif family protein